MSSTTVLEPLRLQLAALKLFTSDQIIKDSLQTDSSRIEDECLDECLPWLNGEASLGELNEDGIPHIQRQKHIKFLHKQLGQLPAPFIAADASRPWFFYWCLCGLTMLGEDVSQYRQKLIETVRPMQNATGGFAGGFGQTSHLTTTYAVLLALMLVGGEDAYEVVDRLAMWKWLSSLKQPDGGFTMAIGSEEDMRGAYCAAVIVSLLNLPSNLSQDSPARAAGFDELLGGLEAWIGRCQTYEGGISPQPGCEAHGAYTFCALGCLSIIDSPHRSIQSNLNVPLLISWLSSRQRHPEGGLSGRTNKLVDGCYSHWVGGCWPLIDASLHVPTGQPAATDNGLPSVASDSTLFDRTGMIRFIMCCCQDTSKRGGMRDKPSKNSDAYHTCYVLSGLTSAQYKWEVRTPRADKSLLLGDEWSVSPRRGDDQIYDEEDRLEAINPVYAIPQRSIDAAKSYFSAKQGF